MSVFLAHFSKRKTRCDDITVDMSTFNVILLIGETFFAISTTDFNIQGDQNVHVRKEQVKITINDFFKKLLTLDNYSLLSQLVQIFKNNLETFYWLWTVSMAFFYRKPCLKQKQIFLF